MIGTSSYSMVKSFIFIFLQQFLSIEHTQIFIMANMWILFVEPVIHSAGHHSRNWWTSFEICRDNTSRHLDQQQEIAPRRNCRPYSHRFPVPLLKQRHCKQKNQALFFIKDLLSWLVNSWLQQICHSKGLCYWRRIIHSYQTMKERKKKS